MKVFRDTIEIRTEENQQFLDVTKQVRDAVGRSSIRNGTLLINSLHTTIGLFVNEYQSALIDDLGVVLQKLIPRRDGYRHDDPRYSDCDRANDSNTSRCPSVIANAGTGLLIPEIIPIHYQLFGGQTTSWRAISSSRAAIPATSRSSLATT